MMRVEHIALEKIRRPKLVEALQCWYRLCGTGGLYRREELGFRPLVATPEILNGRSSVITADEDNPLSYVFAYYGGDFNVYEDRNFAAQRLQDIPDWDVVRVIITCLGEAIEARAPLAHRISGNFGGVEITYDRIIFPNVNKANVIDRFVTLSEEVSRGTL